MHNLFFSSTNTPIFTVHVVLGVVVKSSVSPVEYVVCMYEISC